MRNVPNVKAERHRVVKGELASDESFGNNGLFYVRRGKGVKDLCCQVSDGEGWDHVSVSVIGGGRCPTWEEMCFVKELFFKDDEWVMQFHPAKDKNISMHPYCLHLWRSQNQYFIFPQSDLVGLNLQVTAKKEE